MSDSSDVGLVDSAIVLNGDGNDTNGLLDDNLDEVPLIFRPRKKPTMENFMDPSPDKGRAAGVTLAWQDLSVYVPSKKEGIFQRQKRHRPFKRVLNNVSGIVYPGSLMAVMGASGAGKTTLMNVLAYKAQGDVAIDGEIRVNGMPLGKYMSHMSGFVYQHDLFTGTLTVAEHLNFMAAMRLDRRLGKWERDRRVEELMQDLGLKKCENTRIGVPGFVQGLSGGERKRLAFATEVLTDPQILYCDEPSSGLDSFSAQKIVGMMQNLAKKGKTIICTIHQPSSQVFSMFDQLLLLAEGRTAYMGKAADALGFLKSLNFICPEEFNPADYYIHTLAVYPGREDESKKQIRLICDSFSVSAQGKEIEEKVQAEMKNGDFFTTSGSSSSKSKDSFSDQMILGGHVRRPLWFMQTMWLIWRSCVHSYRNPQIHVVRTIQKVVVAILIGFCYFGIRLNQMGIQDVQGALYVFITENTFPSMYGVIHVFPSELPLFLRENRGGLYRCDSYYISKIISLVPGFIVEPIIFASIAYWMIGLRPSTEAFFTTWLVVILTANTAAACGCFFSAAFENVSMAVTCLIPFDYLLMITGGLFINIGTLPSYVSWTKFLSWFLYANEAMMVSQWSGVSNISCEGPPEIPCIRDGAGVIDSKSFNESHLPIDFIGLTALYCFFHTAAFVALLVRTRQK